MNGDDMVDLLDDMFEDAVKMPLTGGKCLIDSQKARDLIDDIRMNLPQEIRQAKAIVADRGEIIAIAKQEAEDIIRNAEERARNIVNKDELVKQMDLFIDKFKDLKSAIENEELEKMREMMRLSTKRRQFFDK